VTNSNTKIPITPEPGITPGFLPAAAFLHMGATAVGTFDLETESRVLMPMELGHGNRDALLLVRLHGQPLGMVHLRGEPLALGKAELTELVEQQLEARVRSHENSFGCVMSDPRCPSSVAPDVPGSVAVIIPTVGRTELLDRCLTSLTPIARGGVEIMVVDNRPAARTRELVSNWSARDRRVRYVGEPRPGLSVARNRGLAETQAEFVAFVDDDVVVDQAWLTWLLAPYADARVAATSGMVLPRELVTAAQKRFEQYAGFCKGFDRRSYDLQANRSDERLLYPYWGGIFGSGNSMSFRRAELVAAGGFDPALGAGSIAAAGEDMDAMSNAILRGGQLVYEPRSLCWHEHRRDEEGLRNQLFSYGVGLTAMLTKAITHDVKFASASARSVPVAWRMRRRRAARSSAVAALPRELARIERQGMLRGPIMYMRAVHSARRRRLDEVINGG